MRRRDVIATAAAAALFAGRRSFAQAPPKRIAYIAPGPGDLAVAVESRKAFVAALSRLGWPEGTIDFEAYYAGGDLGSFADVVEKALARSPDVIMAVSGTTLAALKGENRIPIVFNQVTDPVSQGFVASLAHPGGNITGFSYFDASLGGKWLALLKELAPSLSRVLCLFNPDTAASASFYLRVLGDAGTAVGLTVEAAPVRSDSDIVAAVQRAAAGGSGVIELPDGFLSSRGPLLVAETLQKRVPGFFFLTSQVSLGGLVSYAVDSVEQAAASAAYVDHILRGANPGDLPIQGPTKFQLFINLKTAKALGIAVPESLLVQADQVIE